MELRDGSREGPGGGGGGKGTKHHKTPKLWKGNKEMFESGHPSNLPSLDPPLEQKHFAASAVFVTVKSRHQFAKILISLGKRFSRFYVFPNRFIEVVHLKKDFLDLSPLALLMEYLLFADTYSQKTIEKLIC